MRCRAAIIKAGAANDPRAGVCEAAALRKGIYGCGICRREFAAGFAAAKVADVGAAGGRVSLFCTEDEKITAAKEIISAAQTIIQTKGKADMDMNQTPSGDRIHIGFFGMRNAGKSSIVNAITGQELSIVSEHKGTTTDPVYKSMELLPLGPIVIIDTPGFDDCGELGELRVKKTRQVLNKTDIAVLVADAGEGLTATDRQLIKLFEDKKIKHITVFNKSDKGALADLPAGENMICASALSGDGIEQIKQALGRFAADFLQEPRLVGDLLKPQDIAVLVTPIDSAAPKGRLILPQQQAVRDILDAGAIAVVTRETELCRALGGLAQKPAMVITDSQAFKKAAEQTPEDVPLTSFSILMARKKGWLTQAVKGIAAVSRLKDGDTVLVSEGCTHHRQCGDIGTVKIPNMLRKFTGSSINIKTSSGGGFPEDLSEFAMVIHCGGCMLGSRELAFRVKCAEDAGVPITNYGTLLAHMNGILKRSLSVFPELAALV